MTLPEAFHSLLQNGGTCLTVLLLVLVAVFAPLVYMAVLDEGSAHSRLVNIMDAFGRLIQAWKQPRKK